MKKIWIYIKKTYPMVKEYMPQNIQAIVYGVLSNLLTLLFPLGVQILIDEIIYVEHWQILLRFSCIITLIVLGKQIFGYLSCVLYAEFSETVSAEASKNLFRKILRNRISFFHKSTEGEIITRIAEDASYLSSLLSYIVVELLECLTKIIVVFGLLFYLNTKLACIIVITIPVYLILNRYYSGMLESGTRKHKGLWEKQSNLYVETIKNIKFVKNHAIEEIIEKENDILNQSLKEVAVYVEKTGYRFRNLMQMFVEINKVLVLVIGGIFVMQEKMSIGELVAYMTYMEYVYAPFVELPSLYKQLLQTVVSMERYFEYYDAHESVEDTKGIKLEEVQEIELQDLKFYFKEQTEKILDDVNLKICKGDKIFFSGKSGQGKSTLALILKNFYGVSSGRILLNNRDISEYALESLRKGIFYLVQDVNFYNRSIRDNFKMLWPDITDEQIEICLKKAELYTELYEGEHNGLETILAQGGANLSGGQKQRLQIAMLFASEADMVILDEPFTGIDSSTVKKIWSSLKKHFNSKTVILIDHNIIDEAYFTRKFYLENTQVFEEGYKNEKLNF